jgi:hypothetical protein
MPFDATIFLQTRSGPPVIDHHLRMARRHHEMGLPAS